jgi:hypothetical protein
MADITAFLTAQKAADENNREYLAKIADAAAAGSYAVLGAVHVTKMHDLLERVIGDPNSRPKSVTTP